MTNIVGNRGSDHLKGTGQDDKLNGLSGNDIIKGKGDSDILLGKGGSDRLYGGSDDDILKGGGGNDLLKGGSGDDVVRGGGRKDTLKGGKGDDKLNGGSNKDHLYGGRGDDRLKGGGGDDHLTGGRGNDFLKGGKGQDTAHFSGNLAEYDIVTVAGGLQITHARGTKADGVDFLSLDVDRLTFADQSVDMLSGGGDGNGGGGDDGGNDAPVLIAGNDVDLDLLDLLSVGVDPTIAIIDPDDVNMEGAKVAITEGFQPGDELHFTDQNGISGSYDGSTGILTLSGTASTADYEAALESVEFQPGLALLDILNVVLGQRTISYSVTDGDAYSAATSASTAEVNVELGLLDV